MVLMGFTMRFLYLKTSNHPAKVILSCFVLALFSTNAFGVLDNGQNAIGLFGSYTSHSSSATPNWTKNIEDNGISPLGFNQPTGIAIDETNHRLFISDSYNNRILVFNLDGSNELIERTPDFVLGQTNFLSRTSALTQSKFGNPGGLAFDSIGNRLFCACGGRVLVFDTTTIVNGENAANVIGQADFVTYVGGPNQNLIGYASGVAYDSSTQRLFVSDQNDNRVTVYDVSTITNGENAIAVLGQPDYTTVTSGLSASKLNSPRGVAVDSSNQRLFVQDSGNNRLLVFDVSSISDGENAQNVLGQSDFTTASVCTPSLGQSKICDPHSVAFDATNNRIFVGNSSRILVFDTVSITNGENAVGVLGQADYVSALYVPTEAIVGYIISGLAVRSNGTKLFAADTNFSRVMVFDTTGISDGENAIDLLGQYESHSSPTTVNYFRQKSNNGPSPLGFDRPEGIAIDRNQKRIFISDTENNRVLVFNLNQGLIPVDGTADFVLGQPNLFSSTQGNSSTTMRRPRGLSFDSANNRLFVADSENHRVLVFDVTSLVDGQAAVAVLGQPDFISNSVATTQSGLSRPFGVEVNSAGTQLFVSDTENNRIVSYDITSISNGENATNVLGQSTFGGSGPSLSQSRLNYPKGLALSGSQLFVADSENNRVMIFEIASIANGENAIHVLGQTDFTTSTSGFTATKMYRPSDVEIDGATKRIFVADESSNRVLVFDSSQLTNGQSALFLIGWSTFTGGAGGTARNRLDNPAALAFDYGNNRIYVADRMNHRVMIFDATPAAPEFQLLMPE